MSLRVLVVGSGARLGAAIVEAYAGADVIALSRASLDITNATDVARVVADAAPDILVNTAAFNDVDGAEDRPADAFDVNAFAVRNLARAAERAGATFVHYSSDFVFDGTATEPYTEESPPSPRSAYAMSKLLGEWFALDAPRAYVLRVESLFGSAPGWSGRRGTLDGIVDGLRARREVTVFTDRVVSPSYVADVAAATRFLVERGGPGLYHCVNSGRATWYDVASEAARILGVTPTLRAVTMSDVVLKAPRPQFCALSNQKLAAAGFAMPTWQDALRQWLTGG